MWRSISLRTRLNLIFASLFALWLAVDAAHIVVEASGVANPAKIAQTAQAFGLPLDGVLVVADAEQIRSQGANKYAGDTVQRQLAQADLIIVNKTDLVSTEALAKLRPWIAEHAPAAPIFETSYANVPLAVLLGNAVQHSAPVDRSHEHHHAHDPAARYRTWTLERYEPVKRAAFDRLADRFAREIFRGKGFVYFADNPAHRHLYQQVGGRWTLEDLGPESATVRRTCIVFIGPR